MPTNEAEVPPQKIWLWLYDPTDDNDWPRQVWANDKSSELHVPYVPASALAEVWEKAIAVVGGSLAPYQTTSTLNGAAVWRRLLSALEAARDQALSVQRENKDEQ